MKLFRDLAPEEVEDFKKCAETMFVIKPLEVIHPVTRKEMIRLIENSLRE